MQRGGPATRAFGRFALRLLGFHIEGEFPPGLERYVLIVAPHTSNWDFVVGLMAKFALGLHVKFLAKKSLFKWPLGPLLRWWGGMPVDRSAAGGVVGGAVEAFAKGGPLGVTITPEGTRSKVDAWKSGFYRIAHEAGVPILPVAFDYSRRVVELQPLFWTTGDYEKDLPRIQSGFTPEMALHPASY
jgi:1-acyl-sn-glycerol-3-phosphate acyltransferase